MTNPHPVLRQLPRRIGGLLLTLFLSSVVIFGAQKVTGDPVSTITGGVRPTPELIAQVRADYHLDDPVWSQYLRWVGGVFTGDFGDSFVYKTPVMDLIGPRIGTTFLLVAYAVVLIVIFGVGSGLLAGVRGGRTDRAVMLATSVGVALPTFVVAILLIWLFGRELSWFPVYGSGSGVLGTIHHLTLPAIALAVLYIAYMSRISRGAVVAQKGSEHVETARVRGIPGRLIFRRHVLYNASPQILSVSGATVAGLFAVSALAEQAFGINGLGSLLIEAAARNDLPVVQVVSLILVSLFVILNTAADLLSAAVDPSLLKSRKANA
ncbi:ABC transporter permease [uncultured Corynebacterium sp.]|uniref:ABC transporter permease n=1 Tax=uncultured Corynebacterium sp. TaxID=159447 RepID=UPI0025FD9B8C|nr:ABC transporter permease [uncultured Corynebacterium sp.]